MTAERHTPGPWAVEYGHRQIIEGIPYWQVTDGQDAICCNQFCYARDTDANARLIAAAPGLLQALRDALEALDDVADNFSDVVLSDHLNSITKFKRAVVNAATAIRDAAGTEG